MSQFIEMYEGNKYPYRELAEIGLEWFKGQPFKKDDIIEDGVTPCIHYGELFTKYGPIITSVISKTDAVAKKISQNGDILFPASDVTLDGLARCSMLPFDNVILGGDIIVMRPNKEYNPAYISYAINQQKQQLLTRVTGGVVKHLSGKSLMTVIIPIPKIEEQNQFVTIAKQADKSKFVGFKSQFIEMFGAVNETSTLSSFISETYPGEWGKEDVEKIGIKVLRTTNFQNDGHINFKEVVTRDIEQRKIDKKQLKKGDIILERSGGTADNPVGRVVYFNDEGKYMFNNFTQLLRCNEDVENLYIFYSLFNYYNTNKSGIRSLGNQTTGIQNLKMDSKHPIKDVLNKSNFA